MVFKCKMCGGDIEQVSEYIGKCLFCKSTMTLPNLDNERIVNLYNRANDLRLNNDFDKAKEIYENILELDNGQIEAHWGVILCKYGVEYVDDPKTKKKIPTCHRTNDESILLEPDFKFIKKESYGDALELYQTEAKTIDEIQKGILLVSKKEKPYDVFICYKETDDTGERAKDSVIAEDIYNKLIEVGMKVFFARITLEDKLGQEYEPYIYSALKSSKVMLVVGTEEKNFNAVWVKNEWSRFLEMMKSDKGKTLIPVYSKLDAYKLPEEFAMLQAQSMDKIGAIQDLTRGVKKLVDEYKIDDVEGIDKETVLKVTAALDEARSIGNGKYEVTILKENLPVWYIVMIICFLLILWKYRANGIYVWVDNGTSIVDALHRLIKTSIISSPNINILDLIQLGFGQLFCILSWISMGISLVLSIINRKTFRFRKMFAIMSILFFGLEYVLLVSMGYFPQLTLKYYILLFVMALIVCVVNPRWNLNANKKAIMTLEEKEEQLNKNKKVKKNFALKEKSLKMERR